MAFAYLLLPLVMALLPMLPAAGAAAASALPGPWPLSVFVRQLAICVISLELVLKEDNAAVLQQDMHYNDGIAMRSCVLVSPRAV
jgi:hypothetical protein